MPRDLQTFPEPQTLRAPDDLARRFLAFCREKPAGEFYAPWRVNACALAQFGFPGASEESCSRLGISPRVYDAAVYGQPTTFGALASRLEALSARAGEEVAR